jgi:hypothetical protein
MNEQNKNLKEKLHKLQSSHIVTHFVIYKLKLLIIM